MVTYRIFVKFTAESDMNKEEAERIIKDALKNLATGVEISTVDIEKLEDDEEEIGGA